MFQKKAGFVFPFICAPLTTASSLLKARKSDMTIKGALESQCGDMGGEGSGNRFLYHYPMVLWSLEILE